MREVSIKLYKFEELSDKAKVKARDWYREASEHDEWWDLSYDDFDQVATLLGIDIGRHQVKTMGGSMADRLSIYFSGFSSQGDGLYFDGSWSFKPDSVQLIKEYAPLDEKLHAIAQALANVQAENGNALVARIKHSDHRYNHLGRYDIDVMNAEGDLLPETVQESVLYALRAFADWMYKSLEAEYEYRRADAQVDEDIIANEYEFHEDGRRTRL